MHIELFLHILRTMVLPYPRCLSNAIVKHDNPRSHAQRRVLTIINTQGIQLLLLPIQSSVLSPLKTSGRILL